MPTYVSMLSWTGSPQPQPADVHAALQREGPCLAAAGLHSVAFLREEGACAAVAIATVADERALQRLAASILPDADLLVESMRFDDDASEAAWVRDETAPPHHHGYLAAVLDAVAAA